MSNDRVISYEEAAMLMGVDHHYVRMLAARGRFRIHHREEVRPNVLKVYLYADDVEAYRRAHAARRTVKLHLTPEQEAAVQRIIGNDPYVEGRKDK